MKIEINKIKIGKIEIKNLSIDFKANFLIFLVACIPFVPYASQINL